LILARTMVAYMGVAPTTVITFDLYGKLSVISSKFKELWNKGQQEQQEQPAYAKAGGLNEKLPLCSQCGETNMRGTKFCESCGAPALHIISAT
ncbi:MAG: zinc ribbon domain-containing protein, partial [Clostridiales bacterium]|nr:zinc ribbon domain-containing protein [Clostridiales bacterium]